MQHPAPHPAITLRVVGTPAPQGSKRGFVTKRGRVAMVESSPKVKPWRQDVMLACRETGLPVIHAPVAVCITFVLIRPRGHWGKAGLRPSAPRHPAVKPDLDKLARSTLDGLILLADDSQVVQLMARKVYAEREEPAGAVIEILPMSNAQGKAPTD